MYVTDVRCDLSHGEGKSQWLSVTCGPIKPKEVMTDVRH